MGLFNIFSKNKGKEVSRVPECFSTTSELIDDITNLAFRYSVEDELLDKYNKDGIDINLINNARANLESALSKLGKNLQEYYDNEYSIVEKTSNKDKNFPYSLDALVVIFNNSLDLYLENNEVRDTLNEYYDKANKELSKVKSVLSDDEELQAFTGLKPVEKVEEIEEVVEEVKEESKEETIGGVTEIIDDNSDVDGDLIINTESMKVYFIRISRNENDEINLNLCLENKLDKEVIFKIKDASVDGVITNPEFTCNVLAETRVYDKMVFNTEVQQLVNFEGNFYIVESRTDKIIDECKVSMFKED